MAEAPMIIGKDEIAATRHRLADHLAPTAAVRSPHFSSRLGADVFLKLESLQPAHSFKARGAFNAALSLSDDEKARGLITASAGNHGLALSLMAATLSLRSTVVVPETTSEARIALMEGIGARVIMDGEAWDDANQQAMRTAEAERLTYVHPFDNPRMMAGAATIVPELLEQIGSFDLLVASIGGGGLIAGLLSAVQHYSPGTRVVGVETVGTDSMYQSVQAGQIVELPAITSIVNSLGARRPGELPFAIVSRYAADVVRVTDEQAMASLFELLDHDKLLVEPAASCCLAALTLGHIPLRPGERAAVVLCGANLTLDQALQWKAGLNA